MVSALMDITVLLSQTAEHSDEYEEKNEISK